MSLFIAATVLSNVTPFQVLSSETFAFQLLISVLVIPAAALAPNTGSVSVYELINPLSLVKSLTFVGILTADPYALICPFLSILIG